MFGKLISFRTLRLLALIGLTSSGANAYAAAGWGQAMIIASIIPTETGLTIVVMDNSSNPMGCTTPTWLRMTSSDPNYALVSSVTLTAFTQGKPVKVWQDACQTDGSVHFVAAWVDK